MHVHLPLTLRGSEKETLIAPSQHYSVQSMAAREFSRLLVSHWRDLHEKLRSQDEEIVIDGRSLSIASVVACARYVDTNRLGPSLT